MLSYYQYQEQTNQGTIAEDIAEDIQQDDNPVILQNEKNNKIQTLKDLNNKLIVLYQNICLCNDPSSFVQKKLDQIQPKLNELNEALGQGLTLASKINQINKEILEDKIMNIINAICQAEKKHQAIGEGEQHRLNPTQQNNQSQKLNLSILTDITQYRLFYNYINNIKQQITILLNKNSCEELLKQFYDVIFKGLQKINQNFVGMLDQPLQTEQLQNLQNFQQEEQFITILIRIDNIKRSIDKIQKRKQRQINQFSEINQMLNIKVLNKINQVENDNYHLCSKLIFNIFNKIIKLIDRNYQSQLTIEQIIINKQMNIRNCFRILFLNKYRSKQINQLKNIQKNIIQQQINNVDPKNYLKSEISYQIIRKESQFNCQLDINTKKNIKNQMKNLLNNLIFKNYSQSQQSSQENLNNTLINLPPSLTINNESQNIMQQKIESKQRIQRDTKQSKQFTRKNVMKGKYSSSTEKLLKQIQQRRRNLVYNSKTRKLTKKYNYLLKK